MTTPKTTVSVELDDSLPNSSLMGSHQRLDVDKGVLYVSKERWVELGNEPPEPALERLSEAMSSAMNGKDKVDGYEEMMVPRSCIDAVVLFMEMIDDNVGGELIDLLGTLGNYEDLINQAREMMLLMKADLEEGGFHSRLITQANEVVDFLDIAGKYDPDKESSPF